MEHSLERDFVLVLQGLDEIAGEASRKLAQSLLLIYEKSWVISGRKRKNSFLAKRCTRSPSSEFSSAGALADLEEDAEALPPVFGLAEVELLADIAGLQSFR